MGIIGNVILVVLLIIVVVLLGSLIIGQWIDGRNYYGIVKNMKNAYSNYQSGALVNNIQVSQDCKITIHADRYLVSCDDNADTENVGCELSAIHDGYLVSIMPNDTLTNKGVCKIR